MERLLDASGASSDRIVCAISGTSFTAFDRRLHGAGPYVFGELCVEQKTIVYPTHT